MNIADEIQLAHERDLEELRREIGTLRHELEIARGALAIALEDVNDFAARVDAKDNELQGVKVELGHALAQLKGRDQ